MRIAGRKLGDCRDDASRYGTGVVVSRHLRSCRIKSSAVDDGGLRYDADLTMVVSGALPSDMDRVAAVALNALIIIGLSPYRFIRFVVSACSQVAEAQRISLKASTMASVTSWGASNVRSSAMTEMVRSST